MPIILLLRHATAAVLMLLLASPALAQIRTRPAAPVADAERPVTLTDMLSGGESLDVTVPGKAGQTLSVTLASTNPQAYFNVLPPGSEEAIFIGSTSGSSFKGALDKDGTYIVRVYLMRAAARRNETADIKLNIAVATREAAASSPATPAATATAPEAPAAAAPAGGAFDQKQELQGIAFHVTSPNAGSKNTVTVKPSGLSADNEAQTLDIDGIVTGTEVGDINADGAPEIYVYVRGHTADAPGSLVAFSTNKKKSMSPITVPALTAKEAKGYRGGDEFAVVETSIARRFKLHGESGPTGKMRQLQYKLRKGEASWLLKVQRATEF